MKCPICRAFVIDGKSKCQYCGTALKSKEETFVKPTANSSNEEENYTADVYEKNINGCLFISTQFGLGSGLLINLDGYGLTNHHVVGRSKTVKVSVAGDTVDADVVAISKTEDLALIRLKRVPYKATALSFGDSDKLKIGEQICVIGNSIGKGLCITRGIVSDKRKDEMGHERIMTDAATNPGNSGGPYLDKNGQVVAIHVAGDGEFVDGLDMKIKYQGMNFGIPINHAKRFLKEEFIKF